MNRIFLAIFFTSTLLVAGAAWAEPQDPGQSFLQLPFGKNTIEIKKILGPPALATLSNDNKSGYLEYDAQIFGQNLKVMYSLIDGHLFMKYYELKLLPSQEAQVELFVSQMEKHLNGELGDLTRAINSSWPPKDLQNVVDHPEFYWAADWDDNQAAYAILAVAYEPKEKVYLVTLHMLHKQEYANVITNNMRDYFIIRLDKAIGLE